MPSAIFGKVFLVVVKQRYDAQGKRLLRQWQGVMSAILQETTFVTFLMIPKIV